MKKRYPASDDQRRAERLRDYRVRSVAADIVKSLIIPITIAMINRSVRHILI